MKKIYKIVTFDLIGKKLTTFEEMPNLIKKDERLQSQNIFIDKDTNKEYERNRLWEITESNVGAYPHTDNFLPYFADVTEDFSFKGLTPRTYKNCQLMTEKHGGYLQFFHKESGEVLRIAMNSHYYEPIIK